MTRPVPDDIEESWKAVRPKRLPGHPTLRLARVGESRELEAQIEPLLRWVMRFEDAQRPGYLTISGETTEERETLLHAYMSPRYAKERTNSVEDVFGEQTRTWREHGAVVSFLDRIASIPMPEDVRDSLGVAPKTEWELLWGLASVDTLLVEEPLRPLIEQTTPLVSDVHRALWELRFLLKEDPQGAAADRFATAMIPWLRGETLSLEDGAILAGAGVKRRIERDADRIDVGCFLVTLAAQNGLVNRMVLMFDGLEGVLTHSHRPVLQQLQTVLNGVEHWVRRGGSPIGIFIGAPSTKQALATLRKLNPKLAESVVAGLDWTTS